MTELYIPSDHNHATKMGGRMIVAAALIILLNAQLTNAGIVRIVNKSGSSVSTSMNTYLSFAFVK